MNKYSVDVHITLTKQIIVEAPTEADAYDKVITMRADGDIVFHESDESDGMLCHNPELIEGTEPFNWNNVGEAQYDLLRLEITCQLARAYPDKTITKSDVQEILNSIIEAYSEAGDEADVNRMFTEPMWLSEVVSANI